jgi:hypothetical protein
VSGLSFSFPFADLWLSFSFPLAILYLFFGFSGGCMLFQAMGDWITLAHQWWVRWTLDVQQMLFLSNNIQT